MKIVYVYADRPEEWNSSEWRCAVPARALNRSGRYSAELLSLKDFADRTPKAQETCACSDVIVVQRNLFGAVLSSIQHWKARDKTVIADFDDAYDMLPANNSSYPFWIEGVAIRPGEIVEKMDPPPLTQFKWGLRLVHGATVPSQRLADDWRNYTDIQYLPNYIDLEKYSNNRYQEHDGIILGWGGSASHLQSFSESGIIMALQQVCRARRQVKVMICGNDQRIYKQLPLPEDQIILQPWVPYAEWPRILSMFDIGLAPLHGAYDERRSWVKILEYMVMKIPWVASQGPAYHDLRSYGWLVNNNSSAWERVLLDMIDHLSDYKQEASFEPYLFGISQSIDENIDKIISAYVSISAQAATTS
jgi:glycosyltransferase involved in cell wall biosynthesis